MKNINPNVKLRNSATDVGFSLIEITIVFALIFILVTIVGLLYKNALIGLYERRAVANLKTIITAQIAFYTGRGRFGTFEQLISESGVLNNNFIRSTSGLSASESISDGRYDYSMRFDRESSGFTLDVDPRPAYVRWYRRFRYRFRGSVSGNFGVILVSGPSIDSPPDSAYSMFEP